MILLTLALVRDKCNRSNLILKPVCKSKWALVILR